MYEGLVAFAEHFVKLQREERTQSFDCLFDWLIDDDDLICTMVLTNCCCCMFLSKQEDGPIEDRHNEDKQEEDNVWEKARRRPEWSLEFHPTEFYRCVEVWEIVSEEEITERFFKIVRWPEKLLPAEATKKGEAVTGGCGKNPSGQGKKDQAILDEGPHLEKIKSHYFVHWVF